MRGDKCVCLSVRYLNLFITEPEKEAETGKLQKATVDMNRWALKPLEVNKPTNFTSCKLKEVGGSD